MQYPHGSTDEKSLRHESTMLRLTFGRTVDPDAGSQSADKPRDDRPLVRRKSLKGDERGGTAEQAAATAL